MKENTRRQHKQGWNTSRAAPRAVWRGAARGRKREKRGTRAGGGGGGGAGGGAREEGGRGAGAVGKAGGGGRKTLSWDPPLFLPLLFLAAAEMGRTRPLTEPAQGAERLLPLLTPPGPRRVEGTETSSSQLAWKHPPAHAHKPSIFFNHLHPQVDGQNEARVHLRQPKKAWLQMGPGHVLGRNLVSGPVRAGRRDAVAAFSCPTGLENVPSDANVHL